MTRKRNEKPKKCKIVRWDIMALISCLAVCIGFLGITFFSIKSDISMLKTENERINVSLETSEIKDEAMILQYYRELSEKTDAAINKILVVVSAFTMVIIALGALLAVKTPKDIEDKMNELNKKMKEATDAADNVKYQTEILEALNINQTTYEEEITDKIRLIQIKSVIRKYSNKYDAYVHKAYILFRIGDRNNDEKKEILNQAINDVEIAHRLGYDICDYYNDIGSAYHKLGEYEKAINFHKKTIKENPNYGNAYFNMNASYWKLCNKETDYNKKCEYIDLQKLCLIKALEINPDDEYAQRDLKNLEEEIKNQEDEFQEKVEQARKEEKEGAKVE